MPGLQQGEQSLDGDLTMSCRGWIVQVREQCLGLFRRQGEQRALVAAPQNEFSAADAFCRSSLIDQLALLGGSPELQYLITRHG